MRKRFIASGYDEIFKKTCGACYVNGYCSDPWMGQFSGVGYSSEPFKMKAIMRDGIIYIPSSKRNRQPLRRGMSFAELKAQIIEESYFEWIEARIQPPVRAIEMIEAN